ncbi:MAG: hypothetical protein KGK30_06730, partial [Elusimicrobia bacterium]|nr:hypothetical protein [Elusimicrobiota bacterium]
VSSYLVLSNPGVNGSAPPESEDGLNGSFDWLPGSYTATGLRAEGALFYQLNLMHDYFSNDVDRAGNAALTPVTAMALVGPSLVNAFYDPDYDDLAFGDVSNDSPSEAFTDDATVIHHEYTHYMVQKIWNIQNFGEAGAISEAIADYFSASSLNDPDIGQGAVQALGGSGPLRELDCQAHPSCMVLGDGTNGTTAWQGEIHLDSLYVSQALWDLRRDRIAAQGQNAGSSCVDNLVFQSLLFFPESFSELINAMETVDKTGAAPACGGPIGAAEIAGKFAAHGLPLGAGGSDPYDTSTSHNDGFETAADIAGLSSVSATIDPASDIDFFTLPAGQGQVELELDLPREGAYYSGYQMSVYDRNHSLIGTAAPPFDGFNTDAGFCTQSDCTTTDSKVSFSFDNPSAGQIFIEISGGPTDAGGSNSRVHNSTPYTLRVSYPRSGAIDAGIVSAKVDNDLIHFSVDVTTWTRNQDYRFAYAQLRDQALEMLPNTTAPPQGGGTQFLTFISSENALGKVSGTVALAPGFNARFPAVGTVSLEVFGYNVAGSTVSLGVSEPMNLSTNASEVKAWNNVFDPERGEKTTIRYDVSGSGRLTMRLYTLTGPHIVTLFDADVSPGKGSVDWTGQNLAGNFVASGIYLLRVDGPGLSKTLKIAVIK